MSAHESPIRFLRPPAGTSALPSSVTDRLHRPLRDLRISVTDRCNFRCTYCMPKDKFGRDHAFLPREHLLSFEEITRVARLSQALGVRKVRLTGGEPLVRQHLDRLVAQLAALPNMEVALTTNGALLARHAVALKAAGLTRITVSLDALDDTTFRRMNDVCCPVNDVLAGIDAAERAGFEHIKVNMVVKRGVNEHDLLPMVRHFRHSPHELRLIEYMDVGCSNGWRMDEVLSAADMLARIQAEFALEPLGRHHASDVAERWRYADGAGTLGIVASVSRAFCHDCSRLRLSPEGRLFTCLFASEGHDFAHWLRRGTPDAELTHWLAKVWQARSDRYSEQRSEAHATRPKIEMSYIGG